MKDVFIKFIALSIMGVFIVTSNLNAQRVTVSPEISIRNDFSYHVIGEVGESILLYQDKGNDKKVLLFDPNLVLKSERQLQFENRRVRIFDLLNIDSAFCVFYGFASKEGMTTRMNVYSESAELLDSVEITMEEHHWRGLDYEIIFSEDNSKIALYSIQDKDKLKLVVFDVHRKERLIKEEYIIQNVDLDDELIQTIITDEGRFIMLTEWNNNRTNRKDHQLVIYDFTKSGKSANEIIIPMNDIVTQDVMMSFENDSKILGLAALYSEKRLSESKGFIWLASRLDQFDNVSIDLSPFDDEVIFEVYGSQKKDRLEDFSISDIFWKADGSPILMFEMSVDLSRRSAGLVPYSDGVTNYGSLRGWSDHYREDIIVVSLDNTGNKKWHQVFYKKQFSQNDGAAFSSYFPFETPSRLRLIYNDEIKNSSTVSEYIFDGAGNFKRTSVLSTEYQNLKLRFQDGLQLSSSELLVPSQKNYNLALVKIDFKK